jgi:hypothetical protein
VMAGLVTCTLAAANAESVMRSQVVDGYIPLCAKVLTDGIFSMCINSGLAA